MPAKRIRVPRLPNEVPSANGESRAKAGPPPFRPRCSWVVQLDAVAVGEIADELAALEGVLALLPGLVAVGRIVGGQGRFTTEITENTETGQEGEVEERAEPLPVSTMSHPPCPPCPPCSNSGPSDAIAWLGRALAGVDIDADSDADDDQPDAKAWIADVEQATATLSAIARHRLNRVRRLLEALELANEDPVVAEVRAIRRKMWEEGGGTAGGYLRLMDKRSRARQRNKTKGRSRRRTSA